MYSLLLYLCVSVPFFKPRVQNCRNTVFTAEKHRIQSKQRHAMAKINLLTSYLMFSTHTLGSWFYHKHMYLLQNGWMCLI